MRNDDGESAEERKPFSEPEIVTYGTVADLARRQGSSSMHDLKGMLARCGAARR